MFDKMFIQLLSFAILYNCEIKYRCNYQHLQEIVDKMYIQLHYLLFYIIVHENPDAIINPCKTCLIICLYNYFHLLFYIIVQ